jgi:hypothetical protein
MKHTAVILVSCIIALTVGCTSKRGLILLNTRPEGATVYLNQTEQGVTPVEFEYDLSKPATLTIEKKGYYPEKESLGEGWVIREYYKGNYTENRFMISGKEKKAWKVTTTRMLERNEKGE